MSVTSWKAYYLIRSFLNFFGGWRFRVGEKKLTLHGSPLSLTKCKVLGTELHTIFLSTKCLWIQATVLLGSNIKSFQRLERWLLCMWMMQISHKVYTRNILKVKIQLSRYYQRKWRNFHLYPALVRTKTKIHTLWVLKQYDVATSFS